MNKFIIFKILLITSFTLLTSLQQTNAEPLDQVPNGKKSVSPTQKLAEINHDTLQQLKLDGDNDAVLDKYDQCPNSPIGNDVDRYGCSDYSTLQKALTFILLVNFDNDKYDVNEKYLSEINRAANFLKQSPNTSLIIEGHTSSQGSSTHNKKLSQQRANEIIDILTSVFSINNSRLSAIGYGEEQLIDLTNTIEAHRVNRRIVGVITINE